VPPDYLGNLAGLPANHTDHVMTARQGERMRGKSISGADHLDAGGGEAAEAWGVSYGAGRSAGSGTLAAR
jgi:hypothetical protein